MTALSTRDALAKALGNHTAHVGWGGGLWNVECLNTECRFFAHGEGPVELADAAFNLHVAEHLPVIDAATLADALCPLDPAEPHKCSTLIAAHDLPALLTERGEQHG